MSILTPPRASFSDSASPITCASAKRVSPWRFVWFVLAMT